MKKIEQKIYEKMLKKGYKIATAESCTGGLVASTIINVNGASNIIDMSFVTYSNESKINLVNVNKETIDKYTVVSQEVAIEMAKGTKEKANANIGLSTTGLAGPTGDENHKVGTVCFAIVINDTIYAYTKIFKNFSRKYIRHAATNFILKELYKLI